MLLQLGGTLIAHRGFALQSGIGFCPL